jgi:hypothetical protein
VQALLVVLAVDAFISHDSCDGQTNIDDPAFDVERFAE